MTPFLWDAPRQPAGRWNRAGDQLVHYLATTPTVAWAEWIRHQEIDDPVELAGVAAALWAVLVPATWGSKDLQAVDLPMEQVLSSAADAQAARLALVDALRRQGAQGLLAPTAALHHSDRLSPCVRVCDGLQRQDQLEFPAQGFCSGALQHFYLGGVAYQKGGLGQKCCRWCVGLVCCRQLNPNILYGPTSSLKNPAVSAKWQGLLEVCPSSPGWAVAPTVLYAGTASAPWPSSPPIRLLLHAI